MVGKVRSLFCYAGFFNGTTSAVVMKSAQLHLAMLSAQYVGTLLVCARQLCLANAGVPDRSLTIRA
jgi:hypothetical protein